MNTQAELFDNFSNLEDEFLIDQTETETENETFNQEEEDFYEGERSFHNEEPNQDPKKIKISNLLPSDSLVTILDKVSAMACVLALRYGFNLKSTSKDFALSAGEKKTLKPYVEAVAEKLMLNVNDEYLALAVVWASIYGSKIIEVGTDKQDKGETIERKKAAKKTEYYEPEANDSAPKKGRGRPRKTA